MDESWKEKILSLNFLTRESWHVKRVSRNLFVKIAVKQISLSFAELLYLASSSWWHPVTVCIQKTALSSGHCCLSPHSPVLSSRSVPVK